MALQDFTDLIKSPITFVKEIDPACKNQLCCPDEIGCCNVEPTKHIQKYGCREPGDCECTYPAPLAILDNSVWENHNKMKVDACLRESRGHISDYAWRRNSTLVICFYDLKRIKCDDLIH